MDISQFDFDTEIDTVVEHQLALGGSLKIEGIRGFFYLEVEDELGKPCIVFLPHLEGNEIYETRIGSVEKEYDGKNVVMLPAAWADPDRLRLVKTVKASFKPMRLPYIFALPNIHG